MALATGNDIGHSLIMTNGATILESFTADYTAKVHHAQRSDGQWFTRMQERHPRFGYRWTAWRTTTYCPDRAFPTTRTARLPKSAA